MEIKNIFLGYLTSTFLFYMVSGQRVKVTPKPRVRSRNVDRADDTPGGYNSACRQEGFSPHPTDCTKFLRCVDQSPVGGYPKLVRFDFDCAFGTVYDPSISSCNFPGHGDTPENCDAKYPVDYSTMIRKLIHLTNGTFNQVGQIAVADNPEVGQSIINTLNRELGKAQQIQEDYVTFLDHGGRRKRSPGSDALDGVKGVAKGAGGAIDGDKAKLGAGAQRKIDKSLAKLAKCADTDSCINASKDLTSEGEEQ